MTSRPVRAHLGRVQAAGAGGWWGEVCPWKLAYGCPEPGEPIGNKQVLCMRLFGLEQSTPSHSHHRRFLPFLPSRKSTMACRTSGAVCDWRGMGGGRRQPKSLFQTSGIPESPGHPLAYFKGTSNSIHPKLNSSVPLHSPKPCILSLLWGSYLST